MAIPAALVTLFLSLSLFNHPSSADYVLFSEQSYNQLSRDQNLSLDLTLHGKPYGPHVLSLQPDCQLVLYNYGKQVWNTPATSVRGCGLTLLNNGQLVLFRNKTNPFDHAVWGSCEGPPSGSYALVVQRDGWIGVFGPELWSNHKSVIEASPMVDVADEYVLYSYQTLPPGIILTYKNFRMVLRENCNLVVEDMLVEDIDDSKIIWQTNTERSDGDCFVMLDSLGELSIKTGKGHSIWSSGKPRIPRPGVYVLVLRYDARLSIFKPPIWTSLTTVCPHEAAAAGVELLSY